MDRRYSASAITARDSRCHNDILLCVDRLPPAASADKNIGENRPLRRSTSCPGNDDPIGESDAAIEPNLQPLEAYLGGCRTRVGNHPGNVLGFGEKYAAWDRMNEVGGQDSFERGAVASLEPLLLQGRDGRPVLSRIVRILNRTRCANGR